MISKGVTAFLSPDGEIPGVDGRNWRFCFFFQFLSLFIISFQLYSLFYFIHGETKRGEK